ncbi:hypothetical protein PoB_004206500 [Plakobranchus ocellatus]|uniref:Uncharacterized protein n=1 Tax=Plakobranchus ocellatus TaxID=259542 RepID=A0AAV4B7P7_9GAST|nr:hypothetical protein PoB_004206500 [Plakobranchus ocellatus]
MVETAADSKPQQTAVQTTGQIRAAPHPGSFIGFLKGNAVIEGKVTTASLRSQFQQQPVVNKLKNRDIKYQIRQQNFLF